VNRTHRAGAVLSVVGLAVATWVVVVPLLGHRPIVTGGPPGRETLEIRLTPVATIIAAAAAVPVGRRLLQRLPMRFARRVWTIVGTVLVPSFAPRLAPGTSVATRVTPGVPHLAVADVLVPALTRITARPARALSGGRA
jgi:hypothetical protein